MKVGQDCLLDARGFLSGFWKQEAMASPTLVNSSSQNPTDNP